MIYKSILKKINLKDQGQLARLNLNHHLFLRAFNNRCSQKMKLVNSLTLRASLHLWLSALILKILMKAIHNLSKTLWLKELRLRVKIIKSIYGRNFLTLLFGSLSSKNSTVLRKQLFPRFLAKNGIRSRPINSCRRLSSCFRYSYSSFTNSSGGL